MPIGPASILRLIGLDRSSPAPGVSTARGTTSSPSTDHPEPVNWALAERVAIRLSGTEPLAASYHAQSLVPDFDELTARAETLVAAETGLTPPSAARARVVDRPGWIRANIGSFRRLLRPLTDSLAARMASAGPMADVTRNVAALEVGFLLGWMSGRVLGQYDLLVVDDDDLDHQDVVSYVGPNVLALEKRFQFPPQEFRLWLALHETTHRAQFTGVPWMREHYLGLVESTLGAVEPDPRRLLDALRRAVEAVGAGRNPLDDGGLVALFAGPEQRLALDRIGGLMSLLEGHGDITMDRAGAGQVPSADRFARTLRQRRRQATGVARIVQQVVGIEAKLAQYEAGERFIEAVEAAAGAGAVDAAWVAPDRLPSLGEIRDPMSWIERLGLGRT
ncbi:MAG TPA: zinc-dependent metalloprotease [Acidimicrobiales bacterium]